MPPTRSETGAPSRREPRGQGYDDVPVADGDAELDPYWLDLRGGSDLPALYMPPVMPGRRSSWQRAVAVALIAVFVGATAVGACLTYGPSHPFW